MSGRNKTSINLGPVCNELHLEGSLTDTMIEVLDGRLFVVGGFTGFTTTFKVEYYNAATNRRTGAHDMEIVRSNERCCVISKIPNLVEYSATHQPQLEQEDMESDSSS